MKKERKDIKKKLLSTFVVLAMILSSMVLLISPAISEEEEIISGIPSVRIYGEEEAVYPTQSYYGSNDFIYPLEYDPFDPGVIEKDSITFNPAFIDGHAGEYEIRAQGDASEKIFLRAFYEPGYTHPIDLLMDKNSDVILADQDYDSFTQYLQDKEYDYETRSEQLLTDFRKSAKEEKYLDAIQSDLDVVEQKIKHDKGEDLYEFKDEIINYLNAEIAARYAFQKGRVKASLKNDSEVFEASKLLLNPSEYQTMLTN